MASEIVAYWPRVSVYDNVKHGSRVFAYAGTSTSALVKMSVPILSSVFFPSGDERCDSRDSCLTHSTVPLCEPAANLLQSLSQSVMLRREQFLPFLQRFEATFGALRSPATFLLPRDPHEPFASRQSLAWDANPHRFGNFSRCYFSRQCRQLASLSRSRRLGSEYSGGDPDGMERGRLCVGHASPR